MSNSDEAVPAEEAAPGSESGSKSKSESEFEAGRWSEADAAAVDAATAGAGPGPELGLEERDPMTVVTAERDEYLRALQRVQAEFENYRKRISRLQDEQSARAAS